MEPALVVARGDRMVEFASNLDADVEALTVAHTLALERAIEEAPEQYFWQHKRWKKRPEGEALES